MNRGTGISEKKRDILFDKGTSENGIFDRIPSFSASRQQLTKRKSFYLILKKNFVVLCDRYFDSSTAYQGYGGKVDLKIINSINKTATCGLKPDITFSIHISIEESLRRKKLINKR